MDILNVLSREIERSSWKLEDKARYLYIRSCELFSYDPRYKFIPLLDYGGQLEHTLREKQIDLSNVKESLVVCKSHAKSVYSKLLEELLNIPYENVSGNHVYTVFNDGVYHLKADATEKSDIARVKMKLHTCGYHPLKEVRNYTQYLQEIDKKIHYIDQNYENFNIENEVQHLIQQHFSLSTSSDEFLLYQLKLIKKLFKKYSCYQFSDAENCISYLMKKVIIDINSWANIREIFLFNDTNQNWSFMNIYPVILENDVVYYVLEQKENTCSFTEISMEDAIFYTKQFKGQNKKAIYR